MTTTPVEKSINGRQPPVEVSPALEERGGLPAFLANLKALPDTARDSVVRHGVPTSDRARSQTVFSNFFLHVMSVRVHLRSLKFSATMGLGIILLVLFGILTFTGILLMVYYKPAVDLAYDSMKDIIYVVPSGRFIRNIHRWAAHGMVLCVFLHMARVFYTAAYKKPREFNWVIGMALFVLTLGLSFTGYLLPWDQLAFWACTIGANIAQSPRELTDALGITASLDIGGMQKELLLGAHYVGQEALVRFYVLHVVVLPLVLTLFAAVHIWRIRKDGGLAKPAETVPPRPTGKDVEAPSMTAMTPKQGDPSTRTWGLMALMKGRTPAVGKELRNTIPAYPNALYAIAALAMLTTAVMLFLGYFFDAPLKELANPGIPENPAKAPWYFLGLQEMVSYSAFMGGVGIPAVVILGLALIPYLDREREIPGRWICGQEGIRVAWQTALFSFLFTVALLTFTVNFGWLRNWFLEIPQIIITFVNPGTVLVTAFIVWSLGIIGKTRSTRMSAIALFTCFIVAFVVLTYFATVHRGPNWDFYWWPSQWPTH